MIVIMIQLPHLDYKHSFLHSRRTSFPLKKYIKKVHHIVMIKNNFKFRLISTIRYLG